MRTLGIDLTATRTFEGAIGTVAAIVVIVVVAVGGMMVLVIVVDV